MSPPHPKIELEALQIPMELSWSYTHLGMELNTALQLSEEREARKVVVWLPHHAYNNSVLPRLPWIQDELYLPCVPCLYRLLPCL